MTSRELDSNVDVLLSGVLIQTESSDLPKQMRQCVLEEAGKFSHGFVDVPGPPEPGWALVRVGAVGMCGTDFHAYHGQQNFFTFPRVLGHEVGCTIVALGEGSDSGGLKVGSRCAVVPYWGCGQCVACRNGKSNCCVSIRVIGVHIDGAMREYLHVPVDKLVPSNSLSLEQLALVETLCIAAHAVARAGPRPGENALVIGAGPIGMGTAQFAQAEGCNVAVMDINDSRLEFVKEAVGVKHTINSMTCGDIESALRQLFGEDLPTLVIDATGNIKSMEGAFRYVAHGGKLVFVGHTKQTVSFDNPLFHARELTIMASRNALPADFSRVIDLIESGKIDVNPWITHRCGMDNFESSFMEWLRPETKVIKGIVQMENDLPPPPAISQGSAQGYRKKKRFLCSLCGCDSCQHMLPEVA